MEDLEQFIPKHSGRPKGSKTKRTTIKSSTKKIILESLEKNMGIIAPAVKAAGTNRNTFNKYYEEDLEFREKVDEIRELAVDYVEGQLFKQIGSGAVASTIFYLKTKGKSRGYIETTETNMNIDAIRIKYIVPNENQLPPTDDQVLLPPTDNTIRLELPE